MSLQQLPSSQPSEPKAEVPSSDAAAPPSSPSPTKTTELPSSDDSKSQDMKPPQTNPRLTALHAKTSNLTAKLAALEAQRSAYIAQATLPSGLAIPEDWSEERKAQQALNSANEVIKEHIALLHSYNEIKDVGQGLMGLVADKRGVRVAAVMEDFGMTTKD